MARRARLASRDPGLVLAAGRAGTAGPWPTRLGLADRRTLPVAVRLVLRGFEGRRHAAPTWPRPDGVAARPGLTRMAAAAGSGLRSRQEVSTIASRWRAACAEPGSRPSLRAAVPRAGCRCSRQPRPRLGAACCRPGDGDARPALAGRQQSPQVRQRRRPPLRYCAWYKSGRAGQTSGCAAGAPLRPPRLREDATGPRRAGWAQPVRVTGSAHQDSRPGSPS